MSNTPGEERCRCCVFVVSLLRLLSSRNQNASLPCCIAHLGTGFDDEGSDALVALGRVDVGENDEHTCQKAAKGRPKQPSGQRPERKWSLATKYDGRSCMPRRSQ